MIDGLNLGDYQQQPKKNVNQSFNPINQMNTGMSNNMYGNNMNSNSNYYQPNQQISGYGEFQGQSGQVQMRGGNLISSGVSTSTSNNSNFHIPTGSPASSGYDHMNINAQNYLMYDQNMINQERFYDPYSSGSGSEYMNQRGGGGDPNYPYKNMNFIGGRGGYQNQLMGNSMPRGGGGNFGQNPYQNNMFG